MSKPITPQQALKKAIEICAEGSVTKFAALFSITQPAVSNMIKRGKCSYRLCTKIEELSNGEVTAEQLRPDVFGAE